MKSILIHCFVYTTVLCAALCCPEEDTFNSVDINANFTDGIIVENADALRVNDTLWVSLRLPTNVRSNEEGEIDIFDLTQANSFEQRFSLFQKTDSENGNSLALNQNDIVVDADRISLQDNGQTFFLRSVFLDNSYQGRFGIILKQSGDFYLTAKDPDGQTRLVISNNPNGDTVYTVWVVSNVKGVDTMNRFNFTVID